MLKKNVHFGTTFSHILTCKSAVLFLQCIEVYIYSSYQEIREQLLKITPSGLNLGLKAQENTSLCLLMTSIINPPVLKVIGVTAVSLLFR